tara:strand:+ start:207 stop:326 length:120 start_codon:yes stop_codon:yes gene_type:complete
MLIDFSKIDSHAFLPVGKVQEPIDVFFLLPQRAHVTDEV